MDIVRFKILYFRVYLKYTQKDILPLLTTLKGGQYVDIKSRLLHRLFFVQYMRIGLNELISIKIALSNRVMLEH